jgi:hypothetical protein
MQVVTQVAQTGNAIVDMKKCNSIVLDNHTQKINKRGLTWILCFSFIEIMTLCQSEAQAFFVKKIDVFLCARLCHQHT